MVASAGSGAAAVPEPGRRPWTGPAVVAAGAGVGALSFALRDPFLPGAWPACPFHAATGLWCPFCGSTRAVYALARGDLGLMLANNPLLPLWALLAVWGWLWWLSKLSVIPVRLPAPTSTRASRAVLAATLIVFWVGRNLPALAFLAPHGHP